MRLIKVTFRDVINFFRNIYLMRRTLWHHRPWDQEGCYYALRETLQNMYNYQSRVDFFVSVNRDKTCKKMLMCIHLLDRIIADEYYEGLYDEEMNWKPLGGLPSRSSKVPNKAKDRDIELLFNTLNKHIEKMWH